MKKKIGEIYGLYQNLEEDNQKYALDRWYSQLIHRTVDEIDLEDITRMISQNILIELGIEKAIEMLFNDPTAGEMYEGQLLELLYSAEIQSYKSRLQLKVLLEHISNEVSKLELSDEDKSEYYELLKKFTEKVNQ